MLVISLQCTAIHQKTFLQILRPVHILLFAEHVTHYMTIFTDILASQGYHYRPGESNCLTDQWVGWVWLGVTMGEANNSMP